MQRFSSDSTIKNLKNISKVTYRKVASSSLFLNSFGQRSQYISIKFPLINSLKILKCATNRDSPLLATLQYFTAQSEILSTSNRPKASPNLKSCCIKMTHRATYICIMTLLTSIGHLTIKNRSQVQCVLLSLRCSLGENF